MAVLVEATVTQEDEVGRRKLLKASLEQRRLHVVHTHVSRSLPARVRRREAHHPTGSSTDKDAWALPEASALEPDRGKEHSDPEETNRHQLYAPASPRSFIRGKVRA